jgi:predicted DNA-binding protein with PD1-like motif
MESKGKDNLIFGRMFPGEDIYSSLKEILEKNRVKTGVVVSGIGQIKEVELGFFKEKGNYLPEKLPGKYEVLSLSGSMSLDEKSQEYDFHLHSVLASEDKKAIGGHLIKGVVSVTLEIVLLKTNLKIKRRLEETTGLKGMFLN